jgi:hypothetical protein
MSWRSLTSFAKFAGLKRYSACTRTWSKRRPDDSDPGVRRRRRRSPLGFEAIMYTS